MGTSLESGRRERLGVHPGRGPAAGIRYARAAVQNPLPVASPRRAPAVFRVLALLLASVSFAAVPASAVAQQIVPQPQTKEQAEQAQEAAEAARDSSSSAATGNSLEVGLVIIAVLLLAGAAWWIIRDSGDAVGDERRAAPNRPLDTDAVGRGAPRTMFAGEGEPGGKTGKRKKREQGRRQRQARKANRPR